MLYTYAPADAKVAFDIRFDEFAAVADAKVEAVIREAMRSVLAQGTQATELWNEFDYQDAILYLTAHLLAVSGEPQRSQLAGTVGGGTAGAAAGSGLIKSAKVDDVQITFQDQTSSSTTTGGSGTGGTDSGEYDTSSYGRRFKQLLARSIPPVCII